MKNKLLTTIFSFAILTSSAIAGDSRYEIEINFDNKNHGKVILFPDSLSRSSTVSFSTKSPVNEAKYNCEITRSNSAESISNSPEEELSVSILTSEKTGDKYVLTINAFSSLVEVGEKLNLKNGCTVIDSRMVSESISKTIEIKAEEPYKIDLNGRTMSVEIKPRNTAR